MRMLSPRETEILEHIGRGFSYAKLSVHNRSEAVYEATRLGWIAP
jgi:DNA-binding CsgD family transcriptional regulator